jgi:transcriptional regulator with XRE-family HTH domain
MSFDDVASRFKKLKQDEDQQPQEPVDIEELYAIRAHMLGVLIRDARLASGFSVDELAGAIGVTPQHIESWEYGSSVPSLPQIELLAYTLQVPISHFWGTETYAKRRAERTVDNQEYTIVRDRMIGLMIRNARENAGKDISTLADDIGIHPDDVQNYEAGQVPVPMTVLVSLSSVLGVSMSHFLDDHGRVGEFLEILQVSELFSEMPEDIRAFLSVPANQAYIRVAMALADIPTQNLRALAEGLIDITL